MILPPRRRVIATRGALKFDGDSSIPRPFMRSLRINAAVFLLLAAIFPAVRTVLAATLEIQIRPVINGEPLQLDSVRYANGAGETFSVTRLSYLC